jgi:hypothetical protein
MDLRECVEHITNGVVSRTEQCRETRDLYLLEEATGEGLTEADQPSPFGIAEAVRGSGYRSSRLTGKREVIQGKGFRHPGAISFCANLEFHAKIAK